MCVECFREVCVAAIVTASGDDGDEDSEFEVPLTPPAPCVSVDSENAAQCLNICVSQVDNTRNVGEIIEICVSTEFGLLWL